MVKGVEVSKSVIRYSLSSTCTGGKTDRFCEKYICASPNTSFVIHNNSINNLRRAVLERVLFHEEGGQFVPPHVPSRIHVLAQLTPFRRLLLKNTLITSPRSFEHVLRSYSGLKLLRYQRALESFNIDNLNVKDAYGSCFHKLEKARPDSVPRVVTPRNPRYNLHLFRYFQDMEPKLFKGIKKVFGEVTVFKGFNSRESAYHLRSKWMKYREPVAIGLDATRFDQHVSKHILQWEHSCYVALAPNTKHKNHLRKLLNWQINNKVFGRAKDGTLKYTVEGGRMSGDVNTSAGNCLIMCGIIHTFLQQHGIPCSLANNGDDCVLIMDKEHMQTCLDNIEPYFYTLGFLLKVEKPVFYFEQIEFCQCSPVYDGDEWTMQRNPFKSMSKDLITLMPLANSKQRKEWMRCVGLGGLSLAGGIPVLQEFYSAMIRSTNDVKPTTNPWPYLRSGLFWLNQRMDRKHKTITTEARVSFWLAFGIDVNQQTYLEQFYSQHTFTFEVLRSPNPSHVITY